MSDIDEEVGQDVGRTETVTIGEWSSSPALQLSPADRQFIDQQINEGKTRLGIAHTEEGKTVLKSSRYVGIVALPDGPPIEIRPKSAGQNFLWLFQYAKELDSLITDRETEVESGTQFLDALAALYVDELSKILRRGLAKSYERTTETEEYVRGRIVVQRQLQRQGVVAKRFECSYEELTAETTANQALLYAATIFKQLVSSENIGQRLEQQMIQLRRVVSLRRVQPYEIGDIELTRLDSYYKEALHLADLIIRNVFVENIRHGTRGSFGLLINMDEIFESVVERAVRDAVNESEEWVGWEVEDQAHVTGLVTGGSPSVTMRPDFVVKDATGSKVVTGDAKWKTNRVQQSDIYQLTAYQLADDVPGALIYPEQDGELETDYTVRKQFPMVVHELPTAENVDNFEELRSRLEGSATSLLLRLREERDTLRQSGR